MVWGPHWEKHCCNGTGGFSDLRGRNGIQGLQRLGTFLNRCLLKRDRVNTVVPRCYWAAVVTRIF